MLSWPDPKGEIVPVQEIDGFSQSVRIWFEETHDEDAHRFIGVINFDNGDALGYIISQNGKLGSKLCIILLYYTPLRAASMKK